MIEGGGLFRSFSVDDCVEDPAAISAESVHMAGGSGGGHVVRSNRSAMLTDQKVVLVKGRFVFVE